MYANETSKRGKNRQLDKVKTGKPIPADSKEIRPLNESRQTKPNKIKHRLIGENFLEGDYNNRKSGFHRYQDTNVSM